MKFVALVSGGKDLFFNILHCINNGHQLVALANLYPQDQSVSELDSFMFQTVGHDIIDYYHQCMPTVKLYRHGITGKSSNVALEYLPTVDDEIEDLYALLSTVKLNHPDIEAVSCGAILSHYQRTRVENVCHRLGLTSLAYLWQRDQLQLMQEMCGLELEARLIKVAAVGLSERHLGLTLQEAFPTLLRLNSMYDVHICGEGGEFETMVFDAPFFEKKLAIAASEPVSTGGDVHYLKFTVKVVEKDGPSSGSVGSPQLLLEEFLNVLDSVSNKDSLTISKAEHVAVELNKLVMEAKHKVFVDNLTSTQATVEQQTEEIFCELGRILTEYGENFTLIQHVTLVVGNMAHFSRLNAVYETFFEKSYLPPSRVCVESTLPPNCHLALSCVVMKKPEQPKQGIHVRSRSYWAPQNIGPYSQAITHCLPSYKMATLLGQIPLVPSSMELLDDKRSSLHAVLSLQHLHRAKSVVGVPSMATCTCYTTSTSPEVISQTWAEYCEQVEMEPSLVDKLLIVQVTTLPKQARVEWGGVSYHMQDMEYDEDEHDDVRATRTVTIPFERQAPTVIRDAVITTMATNEFDEMVSFLTEAATAKSHVTVYSTLERISQFSRAGVSAQWQPVLAVWDGRGHAYEYGAIWEH